VPLVARRKLVVWATVTAAERSGSAVLLGADGGQGGGSANGGRGGGGVGCQSEHLPTPWGLNAVAPTRSVRCGCGTSNSRVFLLFPWPPGLTEMDPPGAGRPIAGRPRACTLSACPSVRAPRPLCYATQWPARWGGSYPVGLPRAPSLERLRGAPPSLAPVWAARARPGRPHPLNPHVALRGAHHLINNHPGNRQRHVFLAPVRRRQAC